MLNCDKISIRKLRHGDLAFYQSLYTNEILMTYIGEVHDEIEAKKYFDLTLKYMAMNPPYMILYVIDDSISGQSIGVIGLRWNQRQSDVVEIGVIITVEQQRKGYAHLAKQRLIAYAFEHLAVRQIIANCDQANVAANKTNQKLGFIQQKTFIAQPRQCPTIRWEIQKNT